ncbi:hypothetical protein FRC15_002280 [Serendipita sp. 397]|nr:hypothetical protein FRC15_002280 [Serendipita sp. 397]
MSSQQNAFGRGYSANSRNLTTLEDEYTLTVTPEIPLAYYQARDHQSGDQPGLETFWPGDENAPWPSYSQWNEETAYLDDYSDLDPNYTPLEGSSVPFDAHGIRPGHHIEATGIGRDSLRANQSHMGSVLPRSGASGSTVRSGSGMDWYMGHLEGSQQFESNIPYPNSDTETISVPLHQLEELWPSIRKSHGNANGAQQDSLEKEIVLGTLGLSIPKIARILVMDVEMHSSAATQEAVTGRWIQHASSDTSRQPAAPSRAVNPPLQWPR